MAIRDSIDIKRFICSVVSYFFPLHLYILGHMGVLKVPSRLCLLLLMLLLAPGSEAGTCKEASKTYSTYFCKMDTCVEACHKEGFTGGRCYLITIRPILLQCLCKKEC
uniref:Uncharacterized protein n=1 Tax=Avena sativa TaxID=4498 RepID=A0ACD6A5A9_AVESA